MYMRAFLPGRRITPLMKDEPFGYPLTHEGNARERCFRSNDVAS